MAKKTTLKERAFINAYVMPTSETFGNALQSYKKAGYKGNTNTCGVEGWKLLKRPKIRNEIMAIEQQRERDLSKEVECHISTISDILGKMKERGTYTREDLQAVRTLAEYVGKIGSNKSVNIAIDTSPDFVFKGLDLSKIKRLSPKEVEYTEPNNPFVDPVVKPDVLEDNRK